MRGQVQGSSPKRHIKYTHNRNPTFHSYHLFDVLQPNPECVKPSNNKQVRSRSVLALGSAIAGGLPSQKSNLQLPVAYNPQPPSKPIKRERVIIETRSKSSGKLQLDSLRQAETQFQASKLRNPLYYISSNSFKPSQNPSQSTIPTHINPLHFQSTKSIIQKQNVEYNIINNMIRP